MKYKAPFPYFGGKSNVADVVWPRLAADVGNYVEPFAGSAAMLLARPDDKIGTETINDASGYVANFWRALKHEPEQVAYYADNPVNENDLHARHAWLMQQDVVSRLEGDPGFFDAKIAGWWVWGMAVWIGGGFCSGKGPWQSVDGELVKVGNKGQGVQRQLVHLGNKGQGEAGTGEHGLIAWMMALSERLESVRVCCGDWARVTSSSVTTVHGTTAVFLDPPYADTANRDSDIYEQDSLSVAHDVRKWAIENGGNPLFRIALCGYDGEHEIPETWECVAWNASNGYQSNNGHKERIWFSPHCLKLEQRYITVGLFEQGSR